MPRRIVIQGIANMAQRIRIKGSIIPEGIVVGNSTNCVERIDRRYSYEYWLGLLSSEVVNWYFRKFSTNNNVNAYEVLAIPFAQPKTNLVSAVEANVRKLIELANKGMEESSEWKVCMNIINESFFKIYDLQDSDIQLIMST